MYIFVCVLEVLRLWILNMVEHGLWCHGASSLGMRREVKMRRGWEREVRRGKILSNKFSEKWSVTGECMAKGPTETAYLQDCHWVMDDEFWKQVKCVFIFPLHHSFFWVTESPKQDHQTWIMESKQDVFREPHQFWIISDENRIISLKTHYI